MKQLTIIFFALLFSISSNAQPRWSPEVRAERETQWLKDSASISPEQSAKIHKISLTYHQKMDKVAELRSKTKAKQKAALMRKKDADMKKILTKEQYRKYYRQEKKLRDIEKSKENIKGPQPL
jgi:hypothetical protein